MNRAVGVLGGPKKVYHAHPLTEAADMAKQRTARWSRPFHKPLHPHQNDEPMKSLNQCPLALTFAMTLIASLVRGQGLLVHDASTGAVLPVISHHTVVRIEDQIAEVRSTQRFRNDLTDTLEVKYAYPMAASASATRVRWMPPDSIWYTAEMVAAPQDTTLPGGSGGAGTDPALDGYLGDTPLFFGVPGYLPPGAELEVELSFVQLLAYANAEVELSNPHDYSALLTGTIPDVSLTVTVQSQRELVGIDAFGLGAWAPTPSVSYVSTDSAYLFVAGTNVPMSCAHTVTYDLDPTEYGLISVSNYLPDSLVKCDQMGNGFFALLIEPEPTSTVVPKDFVIVIDKSGSMSGNKIQEAKNAADFMVDNLNPGDQFNVIAFDGAAVSWSTGLQPFNAATLIAAQNWISSISAGGSTNINSAVTMGIQYFTGAMPGSARTMVFLTDGQDSQPNAVILANALNLRTSIVPDLQLFTFGIGTGYNQALLNQLAVQNNGASQFLDAVNFSAVMADFYTAIENPVLLNPVATFDQPDVGATYPDPLMGLFVGQQMIIVGRYDVPGTVNLHLDGMSGGNPVSMDYSFDLSGSFDANKLFVPKIWAQKAVDELVNEFYGYAPGSAQAVLIEDSVVNFSMCYGIGSPFTSFVDGGGGGGTVGMEEEEGTNGDPLFVFPEPSDSDAPVALDLSGYQKGTLLVLRIYDTLGHLVLELNLTAYAGGTWQWDGRDEGGQRLSGQFLIQLINGTNVRSGRITRL